jgi:hypothetical protein
VDEQPTAIEARLYPEAGLSASFMRWPEELPTGVEPVAEFQPEPGARFEVPPHVPPGPHSLVVRVAWGEEIEVFYALSLELAGATPAPTQSAGSAPQIGSFAASATEVEPGDAVTLTWEAQGGKATLCPSARFVLFTPEHCQQVPLSGSTAFTIPLETGGNRAVDFLLTVDAEGSAHPAVWQISVAFKCHRTWFYTDAPQAGICPQEPVRTHAAAQRFERGMMIWLEQFGRYIILQETAGDEGRRGRIAYLQDPLDVVRDTSAGVVAPDGLYAPASGFGLAWRGDVAGSPGFQETLGWALAPEFGYNALLQCDDALPSGGRSWQTCRLQGPGGEVIVLDPLDRWYLED